MTIIIKNLAELTKNDDQILSSFWSDSPDVLLLEANTKYPLKNGSLDRFSLPYNLYKRPCRKEPGTFHYDAFNYELESPNKTVRKSVTQGFGTLTKRVNEPFKFKATDYVIKNQQHSFKDKPHYQSRPNLENEYRLSKLAGVKIKPPVIVDKGQLGCESFMTIKRYKKEDLFAVLDRDFDDPMSTNLRLKISIALLKALVEQVHAHGIIHRDIKPENIMIEVDYANETVVSIRFIDFGFAKLKGFTPHERVGTFCYIAPETYENKTRDERSDYFSIGKIILYLWRNWVSCYPATADEDYEQAKNVSFTNLYSDIYDLSYTHSADIFNMLKALTAYKMEERPESLAPFIAKFEMILKRREQFQAKDLEESKKKTALLSQSLFSLACAIKPQPDTEKVVACKNFQST
ncbi:MAG: protein kinase [Gammaproteobacteria bacterium]|nr:protein kinase [Gammaproteobacteria bacterium]